MNPSYDFSGQVTLVTGASSGIGLAAAKAFAAAGAAVALLDVNPEATRSAAEQLISAGHQARGVTCDVRDEAQVADAIDQTVTAFGRLDLAFNNAGIMLDYAGIADEATDDFDRLTAINYRGVWAAMKYELRQLRDQGSGGAIVNCSSIAGLTGSPGRAAYAAAKHAVIGLTKSAAREYGPHQVRVNAVLPGTTDTPMLREMFANGALDQDDATQAIPLARFATPAETAAAVLWLCSPGASFVTGVTLLVDGGQLA